MLRRHSHHEKPLNRLAPLLHAEDFAGLEAALTDIGLDEACGRDFINFCRMRREAPMVMMLCTLGAANGIDAVWCQRMLDLYQSATSMVPRGFLAGLPARHVLLQALEVWWGGKDLPLPALAGKDRQRLGREEEIELAVEFLLDHDRHEAATGLVLERWQGKASDRHRLILIEILLRRQSFRTQDWSVLQHWNRCYERVAHVLAKAHEPSLRNLREQVAMVVGENLLRSPTPEKALPWCSQARSPQALIKARYHEAVARTRMGEIGRANECLDDMLHRLKSVPLSWIQDNFRAPGGNGNSKRAFDLAAARRALSDLKSALGTVDVKPFLVSGTLLGYARCGDFLSHDKDIDVGIFGTEDCFHILQALTQSGHFRIQTQFMNIGRNYSLVCWHLATGMPIDIFMYHRDGDKLVTGVQTDMGYTQNFAFTPFDLQEVEFVGIPIYAPSDIDLNLRENFGDWQVPDPGYISHLESPSTVAPGGDVHMMVGRLMLLKAIIKDKSDLGRRVISIMRNYRGNDGAIPESLLVDCEQHYGFNAPPQPGAEVEPVEQGTELLLV